MDFSARMQARPALAIWRGIEASHVAPLIDLCVELDLRCVEITLNTADAPALIEAAVKRASGRLSVGAGTVLDREGASAALDSGAEFLVSPAVVEEVQAFAVERGVPTVPGALTPTEVLGAIRAQATLVKLFPASLHGPDYVRELLGPYDGARILACGGVRPDNVRTYFNAGASAIAIGGSYFRLSLLREGKWGVVRDQVATLLEQLPSSG